MAARHAIFIAQKHRRLSIDFMTFSLFLVLKQCHSGKAVLKQCGNVYWTKLYLDIPGVGPTGNWSKKDNLNTKLPHFLTGPTRGMGHCPRLFGWSIPVRRKEFANIIGFKISGLPNSA
jgi:hypothetical protein